MSATLRYDVGVQAANVLRAYEGSIITVAGTHETGAFVNPITLLVDIGAYHTTRWAGVQRGNSNRVMTFGLKLPSQVALAYQLMHRSYWLGTDLRKLPPGIEPLVVGPLAKKGLLTLAGKLQVSMGLPRIDFIGIPDIFAGPDEDEQPFSDAIDRSPGEMANWMAYADWMSEQKDAYMQQRARVIRGWMGHKALKMKYGIPIIATPGKWSSLQAEADNF